MIKISDKQFFVMVINAITNVLLALAKIIVGFLYNSQLLIADGIHSASDLLTDIFAMIGLYIAKKPVDDEHPFGHGSLEYAASLTVSVLIFFMTYELVTELITNWNIVATSVSNIVLTVSIATFVVKLFLSYYVLYKARVLDSHTLKSSGTESLADAYSTIVVIAGLLITNYGIEHNITWMIYAEKIATIVVILMLLKAAWTIFFNSIVGIAGTHASQEMHEYFLNIINEDIKKDEQNFELKDLIVLKYGIDYGIYIKMKFKVDMPLKNAIQALEALRKTLYADPRVKKINIESSADF